MTAHRAARLWWLVLGPATLVVILAAAAAAPGQAGTSPEAQDLVFLGDGRPVLLRLRPLPDGQPLGRAWAVFIDKLFAFLDADRNGGLSKDEAERAPAASLLHQQLAGTVPSEDEGNAVKLADLDAAPRDGRVTREELAAYYRSKGFGPVQVTDAAAPAANLAAEVNGLVGPRESPSDALFRHLDTDKDGKLSRTELAAAATLVGRLDFDDDETVSADELVPAAPLSNQVAGDVTSMVPRPTGEAATPFLVLTPGEPPAKRAAEVLKRYDKDQNRKLTAKESGLDAPAFRGLDADGDGNLDGDELARFFHRRPDLEVFVQLGRPAAMMGRPGTAAAPPFAPLGEALGVVRPLEGPSPLAAAVRRAGPDDLLLELPEALLNFRRQAGTGVAFDGLRQFYLQQFRQADAAGRGFVEKSQVTGDGQGAFLLALWRTADRNGDGKLAERELTESLDVTGAAAAAVTAVSILDRGRGLLELLDANRDGRLGARELRSAAATLIPVDRNRDGGIGREELPRQFQIVVGQGQPSAESSMTAVAGTGVGPVWFRKMDRNGDGDVSPREFLGSAEEFRRTDKDGDGLLDPEEARQADELRRKGFAKGG